MKISTGMSEIGFFQSQSNRIASEKFYVWPQYRDGKVDEIRSVGRKTDSNLIYFKPAPEERDKLLAQAGDFADHAYSSAGRISSSGTALLPGSFFDAIV
jgi:hypothetical protein